VQVADVSGTYARSLPRFRALASVARHRFAAPAVVRRVRVESLTLLREDALSDLWRAARLIDEQDIPGDVVEAGCARGGSSIVLAVAKAPDRPLHLHDTFGAIPSPSDADGADVHERYEVIASGQAQGTGGRKYYGYVENLLDEVKQSFRDFGLEPDDTAVHFHQGLFQDTLSGDSAVALAHVDGDWYDSVMVCLERLTPRMAPGAIMIIDDYEAWSGCQRAVDDFMAENDGLFATDWKSRLWLRRL